MKSAGTRTLVYMLMALAVLLVPGMAMAVGTSATGTVDNTATLNYTVGAVAQTPITNTASFQVDRNVAFAVAWVADATVSPGLVNGVLQYTVANNANDALGFTLNYESVGGTPIGMTTPQIWIDDGNNTWDGVATETLYTIGNNAFDLAEGAVATTRTVFIVADTPLTATNNQTEIFALVANAVTAGTTTPFTNTAGANTVLGAADNVLADAAGTATGDVAYDDTHSASATFTVASAVLTVDKTFQGVYSDPINGVSLNAKAIPGGIVEYQVVVSHTAGVPAVLTTLVDAIDAADVGDMTLTTYGATAYNIEMDCVIVAADAGEYPCNGATQTLTLPVAGVTEAAGTSLTFDMTTLMPAGSAHTNNGELQAGESVTFRYMMLITP
jgi:hypothetical protein